MEIPPFYYLLQKGKQRLKDFQVLQRSRASNHWKDARKSIDAAIEAEAYALLACWLEDYGEEFIEAARGDVGGERADASSTDSQHATPSAAAFPPDREEGQNERPIAGREFWRASVKRFYRRAG